MILDWKTDKEFALENGIYLQTNPLFPAARVCLKVPNGVLQGCVLRNFPQLEIEGTALSGCVFEDCGELSLHDSSVDGCTFRRVETIFADDADFTGSQFVQLKSNCDFVIHLEDSCISDSSFDDITLRNGAYLCKTIGNAFVERCQFTNIQTDRPDEEIIHSEEDDGGLLGPRKANR